MDEGRRLRFRLEDGLVRGAVRGLGALPSAVGRPLGRALGRALGVVLRRRTDRAVDNLKAAFPDASEAQCRAWARGMWENLGEGIWETARLARMSPEDYRAAVRVEGLEHLEKSLAEGRGAIVFAAHYGNWEYAQPVFPLAGMRLAAIARRMKNPRVDAFVNGLRSRFGARLIHHKNAARESIRWLKSGGVLGMLFDQRIKDGGYAVPFFGRPAWTTGLPALLALRLGTPLHGVRADREGGKIVLRIGTALRFSGEATEAALIAATERLSAVMEGWIREHPERWLWIHNRWKP